MTGSSLTEQARQHLGRVARVDQGRWRVNALRWLRRYAPAEVGATAGALLVGWIANMFGVAAATVYAATLGEFIGFYGVIIVRDLARRDPAAGGRLRSMGALMLEFGPAELLDTLIVRPLAMYLAAVLMGQMMLGILVGKIVADVVFYTVAIICHELGRAGRGRRAATAATAGPATDERPQP